MNVKELKDFLATLPEEADGLDVNFTADDSEGIFGITKAMLSSFDDVTYTDLHEEDPEATQNFVLLWSGREE